MALFSACGAITADNDAASDMPEMKIGGVIYEPYFYRNIDGDYDGIDVRLAREACSRMGYRPVFDDYKVGTQLAILDSGAADCIWSCISMDEYGGEGADSRYMWAGPYLYSQRVMMVKNDSNIQTLEDLNGRIVQAFGPIHSVRKSHTSGDERQRRKLLRDKAAERARFIGTGVYSAEKGLC